ncbi:uncharacterized protein LOC108465584 [Gossypium arboreum]|uniref:uncharacterized protein LOC108465584 n=1 Tax=Gossypium arboreum TaxID=29729 RepID=UPI0008196059|nr:uncharacterized protein LOC108465584 [Gossypium arboreum]
MNIVANALSRKLMTELRVISARLSLVSDGGFLAELQVVQGLKGDFNVDSDGILNFQDRLFVTHDVDLRQAILTEAYSSPYIMYPDSGKMYHNLEEIYWWPGLKRDATDFVTRCLVCQKVKTENQFPSRLLQQITIPE